jgi:hypothetical protein
MALQPRKIGETKAQYDRRVGKRPPRTIGRPAKTGRLRVPPTKATPKPVAKPKAVTVTGKKPPAPKRTRTHGDPVAKRRFPKGKPVAQIDYFKDGKRIVNTIQPDRRRPPTTPTPKKPPRPRTTPRPKRPIPKNLQALIEDLKRRQKDKPKRPRVPTPKPAPKGMKVVPEGYKSIKWQDAGFKPPSGVATQAFERFYNPKTKEVVVVPSGGYTPPKGFIRSGSLGGPVDRRPVNPITDTIRPPRPTRPPNNVEKFLAGRKPNQLNRQDKIRFTRELYKFNQERQQNNISQARQGIINKFKNDPAKLQSEMARLEKNVRMGDAVEKFKAGMIGVDALKKVGLPAGAIDQIMFDRKMFLTPDSPAKLDTILKRRLFQANRGYREQYKRMVRQGASSQDILRMKKQFRDSMRSMREGFAREKARLQQTTGQAPLPVRPRVQPRSFASLFGPR